MPDIYDQLLDNKYGLRSDGTPKGAGYFGELKRPDGAISTELSIGVNLDGQEREIPSLVPTLSADEVDHMLQGGQPTDGIVQKAVEHARMRMSRGQDVFATADDAPRPAPKKPDIYDQLIDGQLQQQEQQLRGMLDIAGKGNPDQAAEAQKLAVQTGLPTDMVERNLDEVRRQAMVKRMNLRDMMVSSPVLARQLTDMNFAKLAFDDHENLSGIEKGFNFLKNTGAALATAIPTFNEGAWGLVQAAGDHLPSQLGGDDLAQWASGYRKSAKVRGDDWMPQADGTLERSWYSGMRSLGLNLLNLPLAYGTGGMGRILGAMGAETGGQAYGQARDAGLNQYESLLFGSSQGVIEAGTEMIGMPALLGMLKPGQFVTKAMEYMVKEQGGEQIATHLQDMNEWAMLHPEKSLGDYLAERPNAALETALSTAFAGGGQVAVMKGVAMVANRGQSAAAAEQRAAALEQLNNLMAASKVLSRSPEAMGGYVEQLAKETGAENVYLQSGLLTDPALVQALSQASPSIAAQFQTAQATGGEIRIPMTEYLTQLAPTYGQQLIDDLRLEGEQFTRRQATEYMQNQSAELQQEVERALGDQAGHAEFRASQDAVKQRVLDELNTLGRFTPQKNELDATLIAARSAVRAAQLGMTPEQFFEKQRLRVQAEGQGDQFDQAAKPFNGSIAELSHHVAKNPGDTAFYVNLGNAEAATDIQALTGIDVSNARIVALGSDVRSDTRDHPNMTAEDWNRAAGLLTDHDAAGRSIAQKGAQGERITLVKDLGDGQSYGAVYELNERKSHGKRLHLKTFFKDKTAGVNNWFASNTREKLAPRLTAAGGDSRLPNNPDEGSNRTFPGADGNIEEYHQQDNPPDRLVAMHNVSTEKLLEAVVLGGMPVPSIGIAKADSPLTGFGDITLLARRDMIDPATGTPVFDADVYSARKPALLWPKAKTKAAEKFVAWLRPYAQRFKDSSTPSEAWDFLLNTPDRGRLVERLERSAAMRLAYLEAQGETFEMPMRQAPLHFQWSNDPEIHGGATWAAKEQAAAANRLEGEAREAFLASDEAQDLRAFAAVVHGAMDRYLALHPELTDDARFTARERIAVTWGNDGSWANRTDGFIPWKVVDKIFNDVSTGVTDEVDTSAAEKQLREQTDTPAFHEWVMSKVEPLYGEPSIQVGRKKLPVTLHNVVAAMTSGRVSGQEKTMTYGAGQARAAMATRYRSIEQIQADRDRIVSPEAHEAFKKSSDDTLSAYRDLASTRFTETNWRGEIDIWGAMDASMKVLASIGGKKKLTDAMIVAAYRKNGFNVTAADAELVASARDAAQALSSTPVDYLEAKPQRVVHFNEFAGAVIPQDASQAVREALAQHGVPVMEYSGEEDRGAVTTAFARQLHGEHGDVLFQKNQQKNRGAFNPESNTISLLKDADLSTFLHEGAHYFFENDIALASELSAQQQNGQGLTTGEQQIVDDVQALLAWHGIQGDIADQLSQWTSMSFEEKRAYHERTAESFEAYLMEGKAPSIELQRSFQFFRAWLLNVYRSLKDFLGRHPEAGKLNAEVRQVFDRMLATTEQIKLAEQARSLMPLFGTPEQAGMTVEEFAQYQAMGIAATQTAIEQLQAKGLRDMQWLQNARNKKIKALQREAEAKRRQVRSSVRAEVMAQPVYRAWQFLTGKISKSDKIDPMAPRKSDPNVLDETQDSLFTAIAKLGGIDKAEVMATWGTDKADKPHSGLFGKPVWRVENGLSIDGMAEALSQYGYLTPDEHGKVDVRELEEKFAAELSGDTQYSNAYEPDAFDQMRPGEQVPNLTAIIAGRLDAHALKETSLTDDQIKILQARGMVAADGLHPDLVADLPSIRIGSGDQLVHLLAKANDPKSEIERLTDAKMLEMYGDLASPDAIQKAADQAVHNDLRGKMLATEANVLAQAIGKQKILADAAREFAANMIARLRVREVKPAQYVSAEVRAAKASAEASDLNVKAAEKRNQVIQHYAAQAAYDAMDEVEKGIRYLGKFNKESIRSKVNLEYLEQIDAILDRFDLRKGQSLKAIDRRTSLAKWVAAQEEAGVEPDLPEWLLLESNRQHYKNLTMEEFRGLVDSVQQIEHLGRMKKRLLNARDQRELDAIVADLTAEIEKNSGGRIVDNEIRNEALSRAKAIGKGFMAIHRKMANMIYEMDGYKYGPMWEHLIRTMNEAGDREASMRAEATTKLYDLAKPILKGERMGGKGKYFPSIGRNLNRGERLAIALNWGNEGNRQRLLDGRNWSAYNLQPVLDSLTAEEWGFVQDVWDFFESYRPEVAAKERRIYGKEPVWVEPAPFTIRTADGQELNVRGGYYPIKYDIRQSGKAGEMAAKDEAASMMRAANTASTTRRSFVKTRSAEIKGRPLLLSMDGIWQGANEVIHDLAFHEWLIDANRLLKRLDPAIRQHYGAEYMDEIRHAILDTARGEQGASNTWERAVNHVRTGTTVAGLGWNLTTALLQPLGISNSMVRVGTGWIGKGLWQFYSNPVAKAQEIQDKSEFMRNRARTMQREINEIQNQIMTAKSRKQQLLESSYFMLIQKLQATVDYPTWLGAYEKAMAANTDEAAAIAMADQAVIDSQGGGQTKDLARIQRGGPLQKLWTNFYSFFSVTLNLAVDQTKATDFKNPAKVAALAGDYVLLFVWPTVAAMLLKSLLRGDDDDGEELAKKMLEEQISFLMGQFVGLRELTSAGQALFGVGYQGQGYSGPAGARLFAEMQRLAQQINQGEVDAAFLKATNNVAGILFHYPAGQVARTVDGVRAIIDGETNNPLAPVVGPPKK